MRYGTILISEAASVATSRVQHVKFKPPQGFATTLHRDLTLLRKEEVITREPKMQKCHPTFDDVRLVALKIYQQEINNAVTKEELDAIVNDGLSVCLAYNLSARRGDFLYTG